MSCTKCLDYLASVQVDDIGDDDSDEDDGPESDMFANVDMVTFL